jgi:hypothetical protein
MALTNYTDLTTALGNWSKRSDLSSVYGDFVALAESYFNRVLRVPQMETSGTLTVAGGVAVLPNDFLEMRALRYGDKPVQYMPPLIFDESRVSQNSAAFKYYTIIEDKVYTLGPGSGSLTANYFQKIPGLEANATNWLMTRAPDVYLYRSMAELSNYALDDAGVQKWTLLADSALSQLSADGNARRYGPGAQTYGA